MDLRENLRRKQSGAVAIITALALVVLVGFAGLALDGGHLYLTKTELQNAADACALAASYELTGSPIPADNFTRGENAGKTVGTQNNVDFQGGAISAADIAVEFAPTLVGPWVSAGFATGTSKYVRCTIAENGIKPWFMQVMGFGDQTVRALATATLSPSQNNCAIPMGMCSQGPATGTPPYGLVVGQWYDGRFDAGGGSTGSFNWIDYTPPSGGESELAELLTGAGMCNQSVTVPVGESGIMGNAAARAWNSRFGLYQGATLDADGAIPDRSGYAYTSKNWSAASNALPDFLAKRGVNAPYGISTKDGNDLTGLSVSNAYKPSTVDEHRTKGADRRLVTAPIVNCQDWATSQVVEIKAWACVLMLHPIASTGDTIFMEYRGLANAPGSPCATSGVAGGANAAGPLVPTLVQ